MMFFTSKKWKVPRTILYLIIAEFPLTVATLTLTGIAAPNLYRDKLWQEGGDLGFNSKPVTILYAYANYRPVNIPRVWRQSTTNFNLVVSVLSMFLLLTKLTMFLTSTWYPALSLIVHGVLIALWAVAISNQTAPDTIDPRHMNNGPPWYITKSCSVAETSSLRGYCMQAKALFAISVITLVLFSVHFLLALWSAIPTKEQREIRRTKLEEKKAFSPNTNISDEELWQRQWELGQIPPTPGTAGGMRSPFTPRTQAFHNLGGHAEDEIEFQPVRQPAYPQPYQPPQPYQAPQPYEPESAGPSGSLPLRERFGQYYQ